jgi:hypothetical protein
VVTTLVLAALRVALPDKRCGPVAIRCPYVVSNGWSCSAFATTQLDQWFLTVGSRQVSRRHDQVQSVGILYTRTEATLDGDPDTDLGLLDEV